MASRLFDLHEYGWAMAQFVNTAMHELRNRKNPILAKIKTVYVESITTTRSTMPSGEVVESQPVDGSVPFFIDLKGTIAGDPDSLLGSIDEAAEQRARIEWESLQAYTGRVTEAAGTSHHAQGQPLNCRVILDMLEKQYIEFDEDSYPIIAAEVRHLFHQPSQECTCFTDGRSRDVIVTTSDPTRDMRELFSRIPPPTNVELKEFEELIGRKREEWNDSRRYRRLS